MLSYVGLVWSAYDPDAQNTAQLITSRLCSQPGDWQEVLNRPGLRVFCSGTKPGSCEPCMTPARTLVILGTVFPGFGKEPREPVAARASLSEGEADAIVSSRGDRLFKCYWGRYVAFVVDPRSDTKWVLRDPSGAVPCHHIDFRGVSVVFSRMTDIVGLRLSRYSINWPEIARRTASGTLRTDQSALNEVQTVRAGEGLEIRNNRARTRVYWRAEQVAASDPVEDPDEAARLVRSTVRACTHAWAGCHRGILHLLSGGLDSSIVMSCLGDSPGAPRLTALNNRTRDQDSDERSYARLSAARAGCPLVERERSRSISLARLLSMPPAASPCGLVLVSVEQNPMLRVTAPQFGATAVFNGEGGDSLFYRDRRELAVIDYAWSRGLRTSGLLQLAADLAPSVQRSIWHLLSDAVTFGTFRREWGLARRLANNMTLVSTELAQARLREPLVLPPGLHSSRALPPGKQLHVFSLSMPFSFVDPFSTPDDPDEIQPLRSQPVTELCLRIPTYVHAAGGVDRAVARRAFSADLPREIVMRSWKAGFAGHFKDVLIANMAYARELLLDGNLVKQGILDRYKVEHALSCTPSKYSSTVSEAFSYLLLEAWLVSWSETRQQAAA